MNHPRLQAMGTLMNLRRIFARLPIAAKMLLGYLTLVAFAVIVAGYALFSLQRLNRLNDRIITVLVPVQEAAEKMTDALLAQDVYEKRFLILRRREARGLFWKRGKEFDAWLDALKALPERERLPVARLAKLHRTYSDIFMREVRLVQKGDQAAALVLSRSEARAPLEELLALLRTVSATARAAQESEGRALSARSTSAFRTTALLFFISIVAGAAAGTVVTVHLTSTLAKLREATTHIARGEFDYDPRIGTGDELGALAASFRAMGRRLRQLEEMYLDASPLTHMPGGLAIERILKRRLESKSPVACCVIDLDHFKAFNDRYGYARGNVVIRETAAIIERAVREQGGDGDFAGHVGGDDFVVITTPQKMRAVCDDIIARFDSASPGFYDEADRARGHVLGVNRHGEKMRFPLLTISIAIVTNQRRALKDPLQVSEIAAELKDHAKAIPKSIYLIDQRRVA